MEEMLRILSARELILYNDAMTIDGEMEDRTRQLAENGTFDKYREIHSQYFDLCYATQNRPIKIESLKRLIFLNWYSVIEPSSFTGIGNLDESTIFKSYSILNNNLREGDIDEEFSWMLSYYSSWEGVIMSFSENRLTALTDFVKSVDTSILHAPKYQLPKGSMDNRGQMGIYWQSCSVEIE